MFIDTKKEKDVLGWSDSYIWRNIVNGALFMQQDAYKNAQTYAFFVLNAKLVDYGLRPKHTSRGEGPLLMIVIYLNYRSLKASNSGRVTQTVS